MPNHLAGELSPYLLQHAENPVDWHAWDAQSLELARSTQKPIFLSIGYSACHWCHVMAHESFEDPQIARQLNENFVSIKVDREERPELDRLYMEAVHALTGQGGWPLSVFLTPALEPFFGGTYWPSHSRGGMAGFDQILRAVDDAWKNRREQVLAQAHKLADLLREDRLVGDGASGGLSQFSSDENGTVPLRSATVVSSPVLSDQPLANAADVLAQSFDPTFGGFGNAPKFPQPIALSLLLRRWQKTGHDGLRGMVTTTLDRMAAGGMYDHLGGGFHRYCVDARWLVPHFEKMLYDNALLAGCYLEAWQATGKPAYERVVRETLDYVLRDMTDLKGGFYSSEDADSQREEGKFYLWTPAEVEAVLPPAAAKTFCRVYDVTEPGNFEGRNILNLSRPIKIDAQLLGREAGTVPIFVAGRHKNGTVPFSPALEAELADGRRALLAARASRVRPARDDKVLVNWNGLMIDAMARAGAALSESRYSNAAVAAAEFLLNDLRRNDGRLLHCWRAGRAKGDAYLDDYAALANALVTLYETQPAQRWLDAAVALTEDVLANFADPEHSGFFYTAADQEFLIARKKDVLDNPLPSGTGLAVTALLRLGRLCETYSPLRLGEGQKQSSPLPLGEGQGVRAARGCADFRSVAEKTLRDCANLMQQIPTAAGQLLLALDLYLG